MKSAGEGKFKACEPGKHTFVTAFPRLYHLAPGRLTLLALRWPGATGLTS